MRIGVDEAGKGPVLGSMFAAAVAAESAFLPDGVADSKQLAPDRREDLAARLEESAAVDIGLAEVPVERIDDPETDMNSLTVAAQANALSRVATDGATVLLDAGDTDADRFARRVADRVPHDLEVRAEHGADESDRVVAAASIVAKVARDEHVAALAREYDADLGSGYPGDQRTIAFLEEHLRRTGDLPTCARSSWATSRRLRAAAEQRGLDQF
ncbi:MAG: ribonuclease HII [Halodesulfurarchaeum sp.]